MAAASSVLLAASRKAGVADWPAGYSPETESTGEKKVSKSKCGYSGIPRWNALWKGLGWWLRQSPTFTTLRLPEWGEDKGCSLCD